MKFLTAIVSAAALILASIYTAHADDTHYQTANMHNFKTGNDIAGAGTLIRTEDAVTVRLAMTGLDKKAGYTIWWIIFNNPDECSDPCGLDDLDDLDVEPGVFYAAGFITGTDGTANVVAHLESGDLTEGIDELLGTEQGLEEENGLGAEIHLIVRSHGKLVVGAVDSQIGTFAGECGAEEDDFPDCEDQQAIAFLPVDDD